MNHTERIAWLTLKLTPGLGNRSILRLVERFGSPSAALRASAGDLAGVHGLRREAVSALAAKRTIRSPEAELDTLRRKGVTMLCLGDPGYPSNLAPIPDPPAVLFVEGSIEPRDLVSVSVVGSRAASPLGMAFTERLCADLAGRGITVVSGLAVGVDGAAHRGALKANGGRTLAVVGCGLDMDYPRANSELRRKIVCSGAIYSEFPLGTPPAPGHFPMRNRIISGLSLGVVVVEAAERSGSLITARLALEQGREVFAVPGMAGNVRSVGPHRLLRQGAKMVESAEDILEEIRPLIRTGNASFSRTFSDEPDMNIGPAGEVGPGAALGPDVKSGRGVSDAPPSARLPEVNGDEAALLKVLDESPRQMDEICRSIEWPTSRVASVLLALELKGVVQQLPGKYFVLARR